MSLTLCQIAGITALVPALQFGQIPSLTDVSDATKEAFKATSSALETIDKNQTKGKSSKRGSTTKRGSSSARSAAKKDDAPKTKFAELGQRLNGDNSVKAAKSKAAAEEQEKQVLGFLGNLSSRAYQIMLSFIGFALVCCIGVRVKEKVKDYTTGRPSLAKSRVIRR